MLLVPSRSQITRAGGGHPLFAPVLPTFLTGLDWDGNPSARRAVVWTSPLAAYPATYLWKVYQRPNLVGSTRYFTTFFHGNNGAFEWGGGSGNSYYGAHPYPYPENYDGTAKWEVSTNATDYMGRGVNDSVSNNTTAPLAVFGRWYSQALRVWESGGNLYHRFYIDLPSTAAGDIIERSIAASYVQPPSPCVIWGQAPDNGSGASWGGYARWEETNGIHRGIQIYSDALAESDIVALAAKESDSEINALIAAGSLPAWFVNMNPTVTDIGDKRAAGTLHHPEWTAGAYRPALATFYATGFDDGSQNPISQGGRWQNPKAAVFTPCQFANGRAYGTQSGSVQYDDSYAYLSGFSADHEVEVVVYRGNTNQTNHEVELHLRCSDDADTDVVKTYEILFGKDTETFQVMRWNGTHASGNFFTDITGNGTGSKMTGKTLADGDRMRARIVGQMITVWYNDVQIWTGSDPVGNGGHASGQPGMGFYLSGSGGGAGQSELGFRHFTARNV